MRKRTINHWFDTLMWYFIYLLPLIIFVFYILKSGTLMTLSECMTDCGLGILSTNVVYTTIASLFGSAGVFPIFVSSDLLLYLSYFICAVIVHLAVDIIVFLPRFAHSLMDSFGGKHD